jgi:hypothetical protein
LFNGGLALYAFVQEFVQERAAFYSPLRNEKNSKIRAIYPHKLRKIWLAMQSAETAKAAILSPPSLYLADMNAHNSSTSAQKTVPPEYLPPMSLHCFCEITGLSKVSAWRYEKRG